MPEPLLLLIRRHQPEQRAERAVIGGIDIFADRRNQGAAKHRIVTGRKEIPARARCSAARLCANPGCAASKYLRDHKSSLILQPGPAALTDGLAELQSIIERWAIRC
jgi:iron complex transport system substrate-binding protein